MKLGCYVYFKADGQIKKGFIVGESGTDDVKIKCDNMEYIRHHWEIKKVKNEKT